MEPGRYTIIESAVGCAVGVVVEVCPSLTVRKKPKFRPKFSTSLMSGGVPVK